MLYLVDVDIRILEQYHEHLIVLFINHEMERTLALSVSDIQIKYFITILFIEEYHISDRLVLLFTQGDVNWCRLHLVYQIHIYPYLQAFFEDLPGNTRIFVVFDEEQVDNVCPNCIEAVRVNLFMHF